MSIVRRREPKARATALIERWDDQISQGRARAQDTAARLVALVNGSAARPVCTPGLWQHFIVWSVEQRIAGAERLEVSDG